MKSYLELLRHVMENGTDRTDRTGVGTRSVFGYQWRHDLQKGFPLLTTKKVHWKSIVHELVWFLSGSTNIKYLKDNGVRIWDEWADADGELGPVYGKQWRLWDGVDQVAQLVADLKRNPFSRRHIVSAWNPVDVPAMKLPSCHTLWQCYVREGTWFSGCPGAALQNVHYLDLHLYARSIDSFLGLPFNIASYALLTHLLAQVAEVPSRSAMKPGHLVISFGDLHIYQNHFDQVNTQLSREPGKLATVEISPRVKSVDDFRYEDVELSGYEPQGAISAPVAV